MHPEKTPISLGIRPVWSVFAVRMKRPWVLSYPLSAQRRLRSDWVHRSFCCPPPFRRKAEGHCFRLSVVRGSGFLVGTLSPQLLPQFLANPFETLQGLLRWSEFLHVVFSESWNYFYHFFRIFNLDIFWALILQKCIGSRYLVPSTPPTVFIQSFWNFISFIRALRMVWRYACVFFRILKLFFITFFAFLT